MVSIRKMVPTALSALLLAALCGAPAAQAGDRPEKAGSTAKKTQLEQDKITLTTRLQQAIDSANNDIDALAKMMDTAKGVARDRDEHLKKALVVMRDLLKDDRDPITAATMADWQDVRAMVEADLSGTKEEIRLASAVTRVQRPAVGVTSKQPSNR